MSAATDATVGIRRVVSTHLETEVVQEADIVLAVVVSRGHTCEAESLRVYLDGAEVATEAIHSEHEGLLHLMRSVAPRTLVIEYDATVCDVPTPRPGASDLDWVRYLRPSRYCESDRLGPLARAEFAGLDRHELLAGVSSWSGRTSTTWPDRRGPSTARWRRSWRGRASAGTSLT